MTKEVSLGRGWFALVDDEDFERVSQLAWHLHSCGYAHANVPRGTPSLMHRFILHPPVGVMIDHINGNRLDNRRENLRLCNNAQNGANRKKSRAAKTSKYKGVFWQKDIKRWRSAVKFNYRAIKTGCFKTEEEAARAYDKLAKQLFGEFARLNFPEGVLDGGL